MHETLQRLADYLERSSALRGRVINAMVYPAILVVVVGFALLFLLGFVVPQFAQMYESLDVVLPWFTRAVLALGLFVRDWWLLLVLLPAALLWWFDRKRRDPVFRDRFDAWLLQRKLIGSPIRRVLARLSRSIVRRAEASIERSAPSPGCSRWAIL